MKKLIILALLAVMMAGCTRRTIRIKTDLPDFIKVDSFGIMELDSCEYICAKGYIGYVHKGNCKYCEARRKAEREAAEAAAAAAAANAG